VCWLVRGWSLMPKALCFNRHGRRMGLYRYTIQLLFPIQYFLCHGKIREDAMTRCTIAIVQYLFAS
jgi:hypothetical protein